MHKLLSKLMLCGALLFAVPAFAEDPASAEAPASVTATATEATASAAKPETPASAAAEAPASAAAAPAVTLDRGDTSWMLISSALVLFMTIPGLALFYGGMVRKKNVLATLMQSFAIACAITIVWMVVGYSLAFAPGNSFVGGFDKVMLSGIKFDTLWTDGAGTHYTIPEILFMMFQMTFAIITPALITGAFAERMKFSAMLLFSVLWSVVVYSPICHWVWQAGGWLFSKGALDFAGGTVVHINAGVAGLVSALVLGKRVGFGKEAMPPHNLVLTLIGASMLWVGWFGFNAGSWLGADGRAAMAMVATQIAAAAAALSWIFAEWLAKGKPSVLGIASGAVAGLVAITPASGYVGPGAALALGLIAGLVCYWGATSLKHLIGYDDSLDAFGVHGVGGILGAILTGVFASKEIIGSAYTNTVGQQVWIQLEATLATAGYTLVATYVLLKLIDVVIGLRVETDEEREGLDIVLHGEHVE
ncbi:ammonium transporter [Leeia oryzae]|uniref:ammonium transporter n=1 Tax=Leeia oryzae TaxID=356662 RepID=UPI000367C93D|nr:ammonium transporter [Leeia oryzae]